MITEDWVQWVSKINSIQDSEKTGRLGVRIGDYEYVHRMWDNEDILKI